MATVTDKSVKILKTDFLVAGLSGSIHADAISSMSITTYTTITASALSVPVSCLGGLVVFADNTGAAVITPPSATAIAAYKLSIPGDHYVVTLLNQHGGTYNVNSTISGLLIADGSLCVIPTNGGSLTVNYVMTGSLTAPTATIYID